MRKQRNPGFRIGTALFAFVFLTTGGLTGVELHPASHNGPHASDVLAFELASVPEAAKASEDHSSHGASHARHAPATQAADGPAAAAPNGDAAHAHHGSSEQCTCVGVCHGGVSPTPPSVVSSLVAPGEVERARAPRWAPVLVLEHWTDYLLPFPNAPPLHA